VNRVTFRFLSLLILSSVIVLASCATQKETVSIPPEKIMPPVSRPAEIVPPPEVARPAIPKEIPCEEDTARSINRSGIETMPFMRISFFDIEGRGLQDMIVGGKHGYVYLYRNVGDPVEHSWQRRPSYFDECRQR
jgi:hypothetical protein